VSAAVSLGIAQIAAVLDRAGLAGLQMLGCFALL
jgi:hypothetical protein